jgi:hypothetical protein
MLMGWTIVGTTRGSAESCAQIFDFIFQRCDDRVWVRNTVYDVTLLVLLRTR